MIADKFKVKSEVGMKLLSKYIVLRFLSDYHLMPRDNNKKPIILTDEHVLEEMIKFDEECKAFIEKKKKRKAKKKIKK